MTEKIKNYLGVAIIIGVLILAGSAWSFARSFSKSIEPSSFRSFSVTAEGKALAIPDVAEFSFSVITEGGKDIAKLQAENTAKMNAAIDFVKSNGVDKKDIKTASYNLEPRYQYFSCPRDTSGPCPPPEILGYKITQTVLVKVRDFGKIGDIFSGVVKNGANSVSSLNFKVDDPTLVQDEARKEAIGKAKEKAKAVAKAGGFRLGQLLSIEENFTPVPYYAKGLAFSRGEAEVLSAPVIEPGSEEIRVTVTLRYEIE
jgi:uncharacterized protein YggE